ncbi:MAG: methyltransferase domain-containing protein [Anaerolineales bacterium]|nr:methyltransferase domain-containing protein [Anaerolineales bacterium]
MRIQPGVSKVIREVPLDYAILDLGCGNGSLAQKLSELGHIGPYTGLDSSEELLNVARKRCTHPNATFVRKDLANTLWTSGLWAPYDRIFAFAVLHHIPGEALRWKILRDIHSLIELDGLIVLSVWNFLASSKLRSRIVPWDVSGIDESKLDPGDYLLDWRRGGTGLRYVHAFEEIELVVLAEKTGFEVVETYYSDGEGGQLGLYHVWRSLNNPDL